jgi:hypothetical protein
LKHPEPTGQLELFSPEPSAREVFWCVPVDRYGRRLPPIALFGNDWKPANVWGYHAAKQANELGPDATADELYAATTEARHLYYALTGDREKLELELGALAGDDNGKP